MHGRIHARTFAHAYARAHTRMHAWGNEDESHLPYWTRCLTFFSFFNILMIFPFFFTEKRFLHFSFYSWALRETKTKKSKQKQAKANKSPPKKNGGEEKAAAGGGRGTAWEGKAGGDGGGRGKGGDGLSSDRGGLSIKVVVVV